MLAGQWFLRSFKIIFQLINQSIVCYLKATPVWGDKTANVSSKHTTPLPPLGWNSTQVLFALSQDLLFDLLTFFYCLGGGGAENFKWIIT